MEPIRRTKYHRPGIVPFLFVNTCNARFQLDRSKLGIVSMQNSPPDGVGHSHWDGICVVFLRPQQ